MLVGRHAEAVHRLAFEIELYQHGGLIAHDPSLVPRLNGDELRGLILDHAAICKPDV